MMFVPPASLQQAPRCQESWIPAPASDRQRQAKRGWPTGGEGSAIVTYEEFLIPLGVSQVAFAGHIGVPLHGLRWTARGHGGVPPDAARWLAQPCQATHALWSQVRKQKTALTYAGSERS